MMDTILVKMNQSLSEILESSIDLKMEEPLDKIPDWSSLTYIQWISALEDSFGIEFTTEEHEGFQTMGQICSAISTKIAGEL